MELRPDDEERRVFSMAVLEVVFILLILIVGASLARAESPAVEKAYDVYAAKLIASDGDVIEQINAREEAARHAGDMNATRAAQLDMGRFQVAHVIPSYAASKKLDAAYDAYTKVVAEFDKEIKSELRARKDSSATATQRELTEFKSDPRNKSLVAAYWTRKIETTRIRCDGFEYKGTWVFANGAANSVEQTFQGKPMADVAGKYEVTHEHVRITWANGSVDFLPLPLPPVTKRFDIVNAKGFSNGGFVIR